jgi:hypothetical protein
VTQGARQHRPVDTARRCAGNHVNDDPKLEVRAQMLQEFEIGRICIVFRIRDVGVIEEGRSRPRMPVDD